MFVFAGLAPKTPWPRTKITGTVAEKSEKAAKKISRFFLQVFQIFSATDQNAGNGCQLGRHARIISPENFQPSFI